MNKDNIRGNAVKDSLLDYEAFKKSLKENTESAVKSLLSETVRETYAKLLTEGEDDGKDYDEEEVEDTELGSSDNAEDLDAQSADVADDTQEGMEGGSDEIGGEDIDDNVDDDAIDSEGETGEDEWAEFDKYKNDSGAYDFSNANDEDIVKVYKLMKDDDSFLFKKEGDKITLQDNNSGTEYLIDLGGQQESEEVSVDDTQDNYDYEGMNESNQKTYELVLEYDSNVGYTDKYQKKDVMTNPGMNEPGKNVNDWDKGVPHGTEKPWSGYPGKKKTADKPFTAGKGKQVEEQVEECDDNVNIEESAAECGGRMGAQGRAIRKSHRPNSGKKNQPMNQHVTSIAGEYEGTPQNEALVRKINNAIKENKQLKAKLVDIVSMLKEAAVVNRNLGNMMKLVTENATTQEEKQNIYERFKNEANSVEASNKLYESITNELKNSKRLNINEGSNLNAESSQKINETKIYRSQEMLDSLDLMHRVNNIR